MKTIDISYAGKGPTTEQQIETLEFRLYSWRVKLQESTNEKEKIIIRAIIADILTELQKIRKHA